MGDTRIRGRERPAVTLRSLADPDAAGQEPNGMRSQESYTGSISGGDARLSPPSGHPHREQEGARLGSRRGIQCLFPWN